MMKLSIDQSNLSAALNAASRAVAGRATLPVLSYVHLSADQNGFTASGTNLEIGIQAQALALSEELGAICVPARLLNDMVAQLSGPVRLETDDQTVTLKIACGAFKADIKGLPADEFPPMPKGTGGGEDFQADEFKRIVSQVAYAASTDEARPVLQGVQIRQVGLEMTFSATDGFRLALIRAEREHDFGSFSAIIPAQALNEAARLAKGGQVTMAAVPNRGQVQFTGDGWTLTSQLIDGNFPDYKQIWPKSFRTVVSTNRAALLGAVRRAEIIARTGKGIVKLAIGDNCLTIDAEAEETGQNRTIIDAEVDGEDCQIIAFNVTFIRQALEALTGESVTFKMNNGKTPAEMSDGGNATAILMPMQI
jgi:DNA polymerase-3 subunit beta